MNKLKNSESVPNKAIKKRMEQHFLVVEQNEYFTYIGV